MRLKYTTTASIWEVDTTNQTFTRRPRVEDDVHPDVVYRGEEVIPYERAVLPASPAGNRHIVMYGALVHSSGILYSGVVVTGPEVIDEV